jgi:hypothetical protein
MIQCEQCEHFHRDESGDISFSCNPFSNIKEPECIQKWQFIKTNQLVALYQATVESHRRLMPMQEKMLKVVERELEDMNEGEKWKLPEEDEPWKSSDDEESAW